MSIENIAANDEAVTADQTQNEVAQNVEDNASQAETQSEKPVAQKPAGETSENSHTVPAKPAREKKPQASGGMSKTFKLVYFPVLALVVAIMLVFSIVDAVCGFSPKSYDDDYYTAVNSHVSALTSSTRSDMNATGASAAREYIVKTLKDGGFVSVDEVKTGEDNDEEDVVTVTDWAGSTPVATVTLMTSALTAKLQSDNELSGFVVGKEFTDVVAAIPSSATRNGEKSGAVVMTVRYDSRADSGEAALAGFIGSVMQSLIAYNNSGAELTNDLVVVFTEDMGGAYGTYAFVNSFDGLGDVLSRTTAAINLEAYGNGGTLALTDATHAGLDYVNAYTAAAGNNYNSSIATASIPAELKNSAATEAFASAGIPVLQVAVLGNIGAAQSASDNLASLPSSTVNMQSDFVKRYMEAFAGADRTFTSQGENNVFFSYFDWGTVAYNNVAAYVFGGIILALIAAAILLIALGKAFNLTRTLKAVLVQLLVAASSLVAMYAAYFLVTLMLTGFGVIPIHAITQVRYFNAGIIIAAMFIGVAAAFGFTNLYKKLFKVTSSDSVRGTALLTAFIGAILCFAVPAYSFILSWVGLLMAATLLVTICLNAKFKTRFGFGMDRLFLFAIPVALCLPLTMSSVTVLAMLQPLVLLPVIMAVFVLMIGVAVPYLERSAVVFDKLAKKLPQRTVRIERTVTVKVEDRAKKGKFTEQTVKRVDKEKVPVNYKNYFGVSLLAVVGIVIALFAGGFCAAFGATVTAPHTYDNSIYNDSIVYTWSKESGESARQSIVIKDLITYKYARYAISGLEWDAVNDLYTKTVNYNVSDIIPKTPEIKKSGGEYVVSTFDGPRSVVTVTIPSASSVTKITVTNSHDVSYEYEFNNNSEIVLKLPYGFGDFTMKIDGATPSSMSYEERSSFMSGSSNNPLANLDEWNMMLQYYRDSDVAAMLRGGIVLKMTVSL